ncbi:MAG: GAF domain-containing protein [Desulfobacterales bacterium]|nr:MAG: GAF domain-containing protein [Desulfobacterales bacterium]
MKAPRNFLSEEGRQVCRNTIREEMERIQWLINIRWWAPILIAAIAAMGVATGFDGSVAKLFIVAAYVLGYNAFFYRWRLRLGAEPAATIPRLQHCTTWQAALDCSAIVLLAYLNGGTISPMSFLIVLPIILVATVLSSRPAYGFAAFVLAGITLVDIFELVGWLPHQSPVFRQKAIFSPPNLQQVLFNLMVLYLLAAIAAFLTTTLSKAKRDNTEALEDLFESATQLNQKFWRLFSMIQAIGSAQNLDQVLRIVTSESAAVMEVQGISVKLLSDDGNYLRYAAAHGLPDAFVREKVADVQKSPLNKRIIEGEPFVTGNVKAKEIFQFGEILAEAHIKSVLFLPLHLEGKVIGILGAYCLLADRFSEEDLDFFRLVAELVAIALENARAYEAVEKLVKERSWYMLRVAHNLRAPLAGMLSILDVVRGEYLGNLNAEQQEYLRRLDRRSRTMLMMVNELMTLAKSREAQQTDKTKSVEPELVARRIRRTFQERAAEKNISFNVTVPEDLPAFRGDLEMVEQIIENLVSNAIKYTLPDGRVEVKFTRTANMIRMEISDTGIGISKADKPKLFSEFFRAENARAIEKNGTGLGLAIVKEFVDKLDGRILVESEEGMGTIFVVDLPVATNQKGGQHDSAGNP